MKALMTCVSSRRAATHAALVAALLPVVDCSAAHDGALSPEPIAAVIIDGVPTASVFVGDSVQLVARPVNANGGIIVGAHFTWRSSDTSVAVVTNGLVRAIGAGTTTISVATGSHETSATLRIFLGGYVRTLGATFTSRDSAISIYVGPLALGTQTQILMLSPTIDVPADPRLVPHTTWEVGPAELYFYAGPTLNLKYDPARVPPGVAQSSLQLQTVILGRWIRPYPFHSTIDTVRHLLTAVLPNPGIYGIVGVPVSSVRISGAPTLGVVYAGQNAQLRATAYNTYGEIVSDRPVVWSTSNSSAVAVDTTGRVTAVGVGSALITATVDGRKDTTTITAVVRATADWSRATQWAMYHGDGTHSGYVPVTADASVFHQLWTSTTLTRIGLNEMAIGGGRVFVSGWSDSGPALWALDAASGAISWMHSFGAVEGAYAPAYADGLVYIVTGSMSQSYLYAFDAATGLQKWRVSYGITQPVDFSPVVVGGTVYTIGGADQAIHAYDAQTGARKWSVVTNQYGEWSPLVANGIVYSYTGPPTPRLDAVDAGSGAPLFSIADPQFSRSWMTPSPVLGTSNDLIAINNGRLLSFDLVNHRIGWQISGVEEAQITVTPGVIYLASDHYGPLSARRESDGSLLWIWSDNGWAVGTTLATNNLVFVTGFNDLFAIDVTVHKPVWSYPAGDHLALSADGVLFVAGHSRVSAIALK